MRLNEIFCDSLLGRCMVTVRVGETADDMLYMVRREEDGKSWLITKCKCCGGTIKRESCEEKSDGSL